MGESAAQVVARARAGLRSRAVAADAGPMAAYMKTGPGSVLGVKQPARKALLRELRPLMPRDSDGVRQVVEGLWSGSFREERYLAIELAVGHRPLAVLANLPLFEGMVREGAWWDLVDPVATKLVGRIWERERAATARVMDRWIQDDCLWIRRTAILGQLKHKDKTDQERLFAYCRRCSGEAEFFVAKAIGWALREHAKTEPRAVQAFLVREWSRLQPLSRREAARRMVKAGWSAPT